MNKKEVSFILGVTMIGILLTSYGLYMFSNELTAQYEAGFSAATHYEVHMIIKFWKNGQLVYQQYHAGHKTTLGIGVTFCKETGNATMYAIAAYTLNTTHVSIGNGTVTQASTVLPNEWARVQGNQHDAVPGGWNMTATITPPVGPNWADCIGLNCGAGAGANDLMYYDTFTTVTGIDSSFTITVEFQVTGA